MAVINRFGIKQLDGGYQYHDVGAKAENVLVDQQSLTEYLSDIIRQIGLKFNSAGGEISGELTPAGGITYAGKSGYIVFPDGGKLKTLETTTGQLKIILPRSYDNTLIKFKVSIANYKTNSSVEYYVSGYMNATNSTWEACSAVSIGKYNESLSNLTVQFGNNGTNCIIIIGNTETLWSFASVEISDIIISKFNGKEDFKSWASNWQILIDKDINISSEQIIEKPHVTEDVKNLFTESIAEVLNTSKAYTNDQIKALIDNAPVGYRTLNEIFINIQKQQNEINDNNILIKEAQNELDTHIEDEIVHITAAERKAWNEKQSALSIDTDLSIDSTNPVQNQAVTNELLKKVDKIAGKQLSTNDFTDAYKVKLDGVEANANLYIHPDSGVIPGTYRRVDVDIRGHVISADNPTLTIAEGGTGATTAEDALENLGIFTTASELNKLSGLSVFAADVNQLEGIAKNLTVQEQIDLKAPLESPELTGIPTAPTAADGTNTNQIATTAFVQTALSNGIAASDAMIIKGTIGTNGTITELPTSYLTGWTYRVVTAGTYAGQVCEVGDLITALKDRKNGGVDSDWCVAQTNINGAITGIKSGDAYITVNQTGSVVTITHTAVGRTNTESEASPELSQTFTTVDRVTTDDRGHVIKVNTKTVTLPKPIAGTEYGLVKSGGDVTIENGIISVKDDSHNHLYAGSNEAGGVANSANKLENARSLQVDLSNSSAVNFNGTKDVIIGATGVLPISRGGTGATTKDAALINLGLTANAAELNTLDGITATTTELNYTDGVTSNIQTQLDNKVPITRTINKKALSADIVLTPEDIKAIPQSSAGVPNGVATLDADGQLYVSQVPDGVVFAEVDISGDGAETLIVDADRLQGYEASYFATASQFSNLQTKTNNHIADTVVHITSVEREKWNASQSNAEATAKTYTDNIAATKQATITGAATSITSNNLTANKALISDGNGKVAASAVTNTELGYLTGVASSIQTQLNNKLALNGNAVTSSVAAKLARGGDTSIPMTFNWSGKDGQPTWLWGGEDGLNMYVYNPSNFNVKYAVSAGSANAVAWDNVTGKPSSYTPSTHTHTKSQITDFPSSMPASDVYSWAKAVTKPNYTANEVGALSTQGGSLSGALTINTSITTHASPTEQCLVINSSTTPSGTTLGLANAPGIGFHIANISWGSIIFDGAFKFVNNTFNGYMPVYASTFYGNLSGNATTATTANSVAWTNVSGRPSSLPASDVYSWAKASTKPSYSWSEITGKPSTFTPATHTHNSLSGDSTVSGNLTVSGTITGSKVYNAIWNDYAEYFERGEETEVGDIIALNMNGEKENYIKAISGDIVCGVHSDTYGHIVGGENPPENLDISYEDYNNKNYISVGMSGRVFCKVIGHIKKGDKIYASSIPGVGTTYQEGFLEQSFVGYACQSYDSNEIGKIKILLK